MIVLDTETTGLDPRKCRPTHVGIYTGSKFNIVTDILDLPLDKIPITMHHGRFDTLMLWWNYKRWVPWAYDTMLLSQLYDSRVRHGLDNLGNLYLGEGKIGDNKVLQAIKKGE